MASLWLQVADSKNQNSEDELRAVKDEEEVVRLDPSGKKALEKRGKVSMQSIESAARPSKPDDEVPLEESELQEQLEMLEEEVEDEAIVPMGWFYLLGLGLLAVILWMGFQIFGGPKEEENRSASDEASNAYLDEMTSRREAAAHFSAMVEVVTAFLAADTVEDRLKYVRHPKRVEPLMKQYHAGRAVETYSFEVVQSYSSVTLSKHPFIALSVRTKEDRNVPILVEDAESGLSVDWESFICYNPVTPEEFLENKPTEAVALRVYAKLDNFFAYEFAREEEYYCFRLEFRDSDVFLFGYVKRGSTVEQKIRDLFGPSGFNSRKPLILSLSFPEGGRGERSVLIEDVVSSLWAYGLNPAEEKEPEAGP